VRTAGLRPAALRREHLSLPYADQVPLLARLLEPGDGAEATEPSRLVDAALHHNVAGHLARALHAGELSLPEAQAGRVEHFHTGAVLQTAVLRHELGNIAGPLRQECGVVPLLIKGPAVAEHFYPDWRLRTSADLDLLVPLSRLEAACRCLEGLGYERLMEFRPGYAERHGHDVHLRRRLGQRWWVHVELHWRVGDDPASATLSHERLHPDAERLEIAGAAILAPAPHSHLTLLSVHLLSDRAKRLAWVNDIRLVARGLGPAEWEQAFAAADAWGLVWPLHRALDYAERHLGFKRDRPRPAGPPLAFGPLRAVEELDMRASPHVGRLAAMGWRERARFLRAVLLPTREGLTGTVGGGDDATTWQLIRRHVRKARAGFTPPARR
jgi:hypothetical protein